MTFVEVAPWITSAGALAQVATVRRYPVLGFSVGLAVQPVWVAFSLMTGAWGFLLATVGFVGVNAWNLRASRRAIRAARAWEARLAEPPRVKPRLRTLLSDPSVLERREAAIDAAIDTAGTAWVPSVDIDVEEMLRDR